MGITALILGILGGLCAVEGILTAIPVDAVLVDGFDVLSWFALAGILLLATIAFLLSQGRSE